MNRTSAFRQVPAALAALSACVVAQPAVAELEPGDAAPAFEADATLAGEPFRFVLGDALKKGPVVLYFYPKAFTKGCTIEANAFAEATPDPKTKPASRLPPAYSFIDSAQLPSPVKNSVA